MSGLDGAAVTAILRRMTPWPCREWKRIFREVCYPLMQDRRAGAKRMADLIGDWSLGAISGQGTLFSVIAPDVDAFSGNVERL